MNEQYRNAIGTVESDNDYEALGPVTKKGDRAYGRYQVMGENIPEWTRTHLGTEMTPDQFLASPEAQDKVFDGVTGAYHKKYGNLDDVTSSWFSGRPVAQAGSASDGYNTVPQYLAKVNAHLPQDGVSAINSAAGIKTATPGALTSAFAPTEEKEDTGALSTNNVQGPGVLSPSPSAADPDKAGVIGRGLTGIGAALAGITSPDQAKALVAQQAQMQKAQTDPGTWNFQVLPDGKLLRFNNKQGVPQIVGSGFKKPEEDPGVTETKKLEAKAAVEKYQATQDSASTADEQLRTIAEMRKAVADPNVKFGGGGDITATAKNWLYSIGVPVDGLTNTQIVEKYATQMQLAKGKQLPGAISNYEDKLMGKANGLGLDKSREANIAALDALEALAKHQKALSAEARKYKTEHGKLDEGWDAHRQKFTTEALPDTPAATKPTTTFKTKSGVNWSF